MSGGDESREIKSAYELALERLDSQGIERPRAEGLDVDVRQRIDEIRVRATARLAELEILHRDKLAEEADPGVREVAEAEYLAERQRIESRRDEEIEMLRNPEG